jgi:hypothetical protein
MCSPKAPWPCRSSLTREYRGKHPNLEQLESWSAGDWERRTGLLARKRSTLTLQLRESVVDGSPPEMDFYQSGRRHGFSWTRQPVWGCAPSKQVTTPPPDVLDDPSPAQLRGTL